jgi:subtilase family serine protease
VLVSAVLAVGASAGSSDWSYVAKPPMVQGPTIASVAKPGATSRGCLFASSGYTCYGPYELGQAYNYPAGLDGTGQTILIVDAYGSPTIQSDLAAFDAYFGIPDPPSFTIFCPTDGCSKTQKAGPHGAADWGVETSLDVEYAHAMAPGAKIVLAVAPSSSNGAMTDLETAAIKAYPGAIVSQSFGSPEGDIKGGGNNLGLKQAHAMYQLADSLGDTLIASAGDYGATNQLAAPNASYPASDPLTLSVSGTEGLPYPDGLDAGGTYGGEQVWNEGDFGAATGGAVSSVFSAPSYQSGVTGNSMRTIGDVAYDAAIDGGVEVFDSPYIYLVGGTSAGSPQWASIIALADQARAQSSKPNLGFVNSTIYSIGQSGAYASTFHDITVGNNALNGPGFNAGTGYDIPTGWGTPNVANLVAALAAH